MEKDNTDKKTKGQYLHADLTREIIGAVYDIHNKLGFGYREKEYQLALVEELKKRGLSFARELYCNLIYEGKVISKFYIDFLVEGKVVVELKVADAFYKKHFDQVMTYLKANNLKVGLLIVFTKLKVLVKRIAN